MLSRLCLQTFHCKGYALALDLILHDAGGQYVTALALEGNIAAVIDEPAALPLPFC